MSQNVSLGVQMKMSRGELMGFNGCLGYDYHPEDKSITINEKEAETVRMICMCRDMVLIRLRRSLRDWEK